MQSMQIALLLNGQTVRYGNENYAFSCPSMLVGSEMIHIETGLQPKHLFSMQCSDFRSLQPMMIDLLDKPLGSARRDGRLRQFPIDLSMVQVVSCLNDISRDAALRFLYAYCLTRDRRYFSDLLWEYSTTDESFFEYVEANYRNPWSAAEFARRLDVPLRKLNFVFMDRCGMTAKRWLLERRLQYAREMLLSSHWRVIDVALECGFVSHAHFTETFHRRFGFSPTEIRKAGHQRSHGESAVQAPHDAVGLAG